MKLQNLIRSYRFFVADVNYFHLKIFPGRCVTFYYLFIHQKRVQHSIIIQNNNDVPWTYYYLQCAKKMSSPQKPKWTDFRTVDRSMSFHHHIRLLMRQFKELLPPQDSVKILLDVIAQFEALPFPMNVFLTLPDNMVTAPRIRLHTSSNSISQTVEWCTSRCDASRFNLTNTPARSPSAWLPFCVSSWSWKRLIFTFITHLILWIWSHSKSTKAAPST